MSFESIKSTPESLFSIEIGECSSIDSTTTAADQRVCELRYPRTHGPRPTGVVDLLPATATRTATTTIIDDKIIKIVMDDEQWKDTGKDTDNA